ncbi:FmdB family zinc ribbon protein [Dictyobacter arantiisoli]|uniref:FmdB family zinc ribbon protein n=1 Tax=Dictyobacter arantiisoli TaxID=2014874 RepID=UPI0011F014BB|nr:FmdB family zinc ribbon protein [Dictyobacter arantiisoli]
MPRYEFCCEQCGSFECFRSLAEATAPMPCPECQRIARRIYTAPGLVRTPPAQASARYRAEKSAYEPEIIHTYPDKRQKRPAPPIVHQSHGRPWMLGH